MSFSLRPWRDTDLDSLVQHANNARIAQYMTDRFPHPYTAAHAKTFIAMATDTTPHNILAIDVGGAAVGGIGLHPMEDIYCKNAELGYWLAEPYWGRGIATQAVVQMLRYGFGHWPVTRIFARPFGTNVASQRVLEKAGFKLEARFEKTIFKAGEYIDELVYAVRREDGKLTDDS